MDIKKAKELYEYERGEYSKYVDNVRDAKTSLQNLKTEIEKRFSTDEVRRSVRAVVKAHNKNDDAVVLNLRPEVFFIRWALEISGKVVKETDDYEDYTWPTDLIVIPLDDIPGLMEKGLTGENLEKYYVNEEN